VGGYLPGLGARLSGSWVATTPAGERRLRCRADYGLSAAGGEVPCGWGRMLSLLGVMGRRDIFSCDWLPALNAFCRIALFLDPVFFFF